MRRRGGSGRTDGRARTSRGHGAGPVEHGDQSRSFPAPRSTSTMVTQIHPGHQVCASDLISAITHRVVGYAWDGSSLTLGTHTNYSGGRTVADGLIFEGFPKWIRLDGSDSFGDAVVKVGLR